MSDRCAKCNGKMPEREPGASGRKPTICPDCKAAKPVKRHYKAREKKQVKTSPAPAAIRQKRAKTPQSKALLSLAEEMPKQPIPSEFAMMTDLNYGSQIRHFNHYTYQRYGIEEDPSRREALAVIMVHLCKLERLFKV